MRRLDRGHRQLVDGYGLRSVLRKKMQETVYDG